MEADKFINFHTTEDFVLDNEFPHWVLHPTEELDQFWETFIIEHPEKENLIKDAALIIRSLQPVRQDVPQQKLDEIFQRVRKSERKLFLTWYSGLKYAAIIAALISVGSLTYYSIKKQNQFPLEIASETILKGKVILSDGSVKEFDTDRTTINQTASGNLTINSDTIDVNSGQETSALNHVVIPYGKRSEITLADGTHIWLNSGSQLSYPSKFKTDSREVYLSGEALFDVKPNPDKPFFVITRDIRIKVLGTSFNVSSYADDNTVQTILINGKVSAGKNKLFAGTMDLIPGERLIYDKNKAELIKDKVDVNLYTSWITGYLVFKNVPLSEVYTKLTRFYNQKISVDGGLENITFSGKLDLGSNLKDVLEDIAFASSVNVQENNGSFIIKK